MSHHDIYKVSDGTSVTVTEDKNYTDNNINDWIFRGDFDWQPPTIHA